MDDALLDCDDSGEHDRQVSGGGQQQHQRPLTDTRRRQNLLRHIPYDEMERRLRLNEQCNHRLLIERQMPDQLLKEIPACGDFIEHPAPYTYMQQWAALNLAEEGRR